MTTTPATPPAETTSPDDSAYRVLQRMFDEGFSTGNVDIVDLLCAPDLVEHQFGLQGRGAEALDHLRAAITDVHAAFPDATFTIEDWVHDGATIWARVHGRATASGPFFGAPSNRPVDFTVVDIARVVDGRIAEHWGVPDRFALLAQTGVLDRLVACPPPGPPV